MASLFYSKSREEKKESALIPNCLKMPQNANKKLKIPYWLALPRRLNFQDSQDIFCKLADMNLFKMQRRWA
jgi:hypothetical protein